MRQVFAAGGRAVVLDVPEPALRPGEVLVETAFSVISSGTERHIIDATAAAGDASETAHRPPNPPQLRDGGVRWDGPQPRSAPPGTALLGYSLAGTVLAVAPEVTDLRPGDYVACAGNQCAVHAERVAVPRSLTAPVPAGLALDRAAFATLGAIGVYNLRRSGCRFGETVIVYGLGPLGLLMVQIARRAGLDAVGLDIDDRRVALARALGARLALNPSRDDPVAAVRALTDGFGADAVLLSLVTPSSAPLNLAFDLCRQRGRVVGVGLFGMAIERERMYARDVTFLPSLAYGAGRYDPVFEEGNVDYPIGHARWTESRNLRYALRLLAEGAVEVAPLAPARVPLAEAPRAYELLRAPDRPPTVLLTYGAA
jgi:threonine dehydrogenase-like Zn-dependent dehydrogenase